MAQVILAAMLLFVCTGMTCADTGTSADAVLREVATDIGFTDQIETIVKSVIEELGYTSAESLGQITEEQWSYINVPGGFLRALRQHLHDLPASLIKYMMSQSKMSLHKIEQLIRSGADVNARSDQGDAPLHLASEKGHNQIVRLLLGTRAEADARSKFGSTPLMHSSYEGHVEICQELILAGASVDVQDRSLNSPIKYASYKGHHETVKVLVQSKADPGMRNEADVTPLMTASHEGHTQVLQALIQARASVNAKCLRHPLFEASGHHQVSQLLIKAEADVNVRDMNFHTPIMFAASHGYVEVVRLLIAGMANVNAKNTWGETPVKLAEKGGHIEVVKLLRDQQSGEF